MMTDHQPARPVPIDEARAREVITDKRVLDFLEFGFRNISLPRKGLDSDDLADIRQALIDVVKDALVTEAAQPAAGAEVPADAAREYFERGFLASYAWHVTKREGETLSDAVLDHAWDNREEGGPLPTLTATPKAPPSTAGEVERLARVLCAAETGGPIGYFPDGSPMRTGGVWEEYAEYQHEEWRRVARAVLAALSTPSPVASGAGGEDFTATVRVTPDGKSVTVEHKFDADWEKVLLVHEALRDWAAQRIAGHNACPYRPVDAREPTPQVPNDEVRAALEDLTRPLVGIENRTPEEVRDILFDRIRRKFAALSGERKA